MPDNRHIFLSYSSKEIDFALKLATDLKNAGINLWMDRLDIKPGEDWRKSLQAGIDLSSAVLVILSESSLQSQYCQREIARADRLGNPIVPILLTPLSAADWPLEIERQQYVDFTHWQDELRYQQELVHLLAYLKETFNIHTGTVPNKETQYLIRLIATLKSRCSFHVQDKSDIRPEPFSAFKWNLEITHPAQHRIDTYFRADLLQNRHHSIIDKVLDKFTIQSQLALIGAPGTGKTCFLEYLCLQFAYKRQMSPDQEPLPILVRLSDWQHDVPLAKFLNQFIPFKVDLAQTVFLVDGLDEISSDHVDKLSQIHDWLNTEQRGIFTCRSQSFTEEFEQHGMPTVTVYDLDIQQIRTFLSATVSEERANRILDEYPCKYLQQALRNPLVLSLLASATQHLPFENIGVIIRQLVEDLSSHKQQQGIGGTISYPALERGLAKLAFEPQPSIPYKSAELFIGDVAILEMGKRIGFLTIRDTQITFNYPIFRSYFASVWLHLNDLDWQQVKERDDFNCIILCLAGISPKRDDLVCAIYQDHPELALYCLVTDVASSTVQTVLSHWLRSEQQPNLSILPDLSTVTKALISIMRDDPWPIRQAAYKLLQTLDLPTLPGIEEMVKMDIDEREDAIIALKQIGTRALPTLIYHLQDPETNVRQNAAWALGELADRACIPPLVAALNDSSAPVVIQAIQALGYQHDSDTLLPLVNMLGHPNATVQQTTFKTLYWMRIDTSHALAKALDHAEQQVRENVLVLLAQQSGEIVTETLLKATYHTHLDVQLGAIVALETRESAEVIDRLAECLDAKPLHDAALAVLKRFRSPVAHQIVFEATQPTSKKQSAVMAKTRLKQAVTANHMPKPKERSASTTHQPHAILDQLLMRLRETEWGEREETAKALRDYAKTLQGETVPHILNRLTALLSDDNWIIRWAVVEPIAWIGDESAVPDLIACLEDENWMVRVAAIRGLQEIKNLAALDAIETRLNDPNTVVREAAIEALGVLGGEQIIPTLATVLDDPDEIIRLATVQALALMRQKEAKRFLEIMLHDSDKYVRWAAVFGLREIADESTVKALIPCLSDIEKPHWEEERICDLAVNLLEKIGTDRAKEALVQWKNDHIDNRVNK
jgi:HEAT repeat protein